MHEPTFGRTKDGQPVHARTVDHLEHETPIQRLNAKVGLKITTLVGTMWAAYIFAIIAVIALPSALSSGSILELVIWLSSSFLQLVLLPIIIVGQQIQSKAADARSAKTFEDTEAIIHALNVRTEGGLKDAVDILTQVIDDRVNTATQELKKPAPRKRVAKKAPAAKKTATRRTAK